MKEYFKYATGFVNLNDENLFLTNSGNWSETHELLEKSNKSKRQNDLKGIKIVMFFLILAAICLFLISKSNSVRIITPLAVLGLFSYRYLKRETGNRYKIPIAKITSIEIIEKQATLHFLNAANQEDTEIIQNVDAKGLTLLEELKRQKLKSSIFAT